MINEILEMQSQAGSKDGERIIRLTGVLTIHTLFNFQSAVRAETSPALVLDFSGVSYVDSAGLGAIVGALLSYQKAGRKFLLAGVNDRVTALMSMTNVQKMMPTFASVELAEASLS
ncbi:MAG: STAS domain-containing protein [Candidatus Acidiferrales bacterium]|jgi:anti-sigma B factor antagonist